MCKLKPQLNQWINKIKRIEKQTHQEIFTLFGPTMTYFGGERSLHFTIQWVLYKEIQKGYDILASTSS